MRIRGGENSVGFGDNFYYQMVSFIRRFKGISGVDAAQGQTTITPSSDISAWSSVGPEYRDTIGDTAYRNNVSFGSVYRYVNNTGRNDIDYAKISQDTDYLYFLVTTQSALVKVDEENWMNLFINIDDNYDTGWEGYDFMLNRSRDGSTVSVERFLNNTWELETVGTAEYVTGEQSLTIKLDKKLIGVEGTAKKFLFKWADNSTVNGDIMAFMDTGDTAPDSRFAFIYTSEDIVPTVINDSASNTLTKIVIGISAAIAVAAVAVALFVIRGSNKGKDGSATAK